MCMVDEACSISFSRRLVRCFSRRLVRCEGPLSSLVLRYLEAECPGAGGVNWYDCSLSL